MWLQRNGDTDMTHITETQACTYAKSLFEGNTLVWDVRTSNENEGCLDVEVFNPEQVGGDGFAVVTCWLENGQPYGEW
jgi:hypothetical protein